MLAQSKFVKVTFDLIAFIIIIVLTAIAFYLLFFSSIFTIKEIVCYENFKPCQNENVVVELDKYKGQNLFRTTTSGIESRLKSGDFMIKDVKIQKLFPNKIIVSTFAVNAEGAVALVKEPNVWLLTDRAGRVIRMVTENPNTPTIYVNELTQVRIGQPIPSEPLRSAISCMILIRDSNLLVGKYYLIDEKTLVVTLTTGHKVLFGIDKNCDEQVKALQAILSDSTMKKDTYQTIDLRFAQPVLRQN